MSLMNCPIYKRCKDKKYKKCIQIIFAVTIVIGLCLLSAMEAAAEPEDGKGLLQEESSINIWGGEVETTRIENGYEIITDGKAIEDPYQYVAVNFNFSTLGRFSKEGGISFFVKNTGTHEMYFNFALNDIDGNRLNFRTDGMMLTGRDRALIMENEWIILEPGFSGTITIPFLECEAIDENGESTDSFNYKSCYGMTIMTMLVQDVEGGFCVTGADVVQPEDIPDLSESNGISLEGPSQVKLPLLGEFRQQYQLAGANAENYEFTETNYGEYIRLDSQGILHITSGCKPSKIMLRLRNKKSNLIIERQLTLYENWRQDSEVYTFYSPSEVPKITYLMEFLNDERYVKIARMVGILIVVVPLCAYAYARFKKRIGLRKLKKGEL